MSLCHFHCKLPSDTAWLGVREFASSARASLTEQGWSAAETFGDGDDSRVADFLSSSATQRAEEVIGSQQVLRLTVQDSWFFAQLVLNPPLPSDALRGAARRHEELIGQ
jgi:uncharacterized protein (DUF1778 family)